MRSSMRVRARADAVAVSALTAAAWLPWLPWLAIGLLAGAGVDRFARRPLMQMCNIASLLLLLSIPAAAWFGMLTIGHLLVVALLTGVASVFFQTAYQVYLPGVIGDDHLTEANAALQGSESVAQVAGPTSPARLGARLRVSGWRQRAVGRRAGFAGRR